MTIVVTGATGNVGRPLVCQLAAAGARVRAVTRNPHPAGFPTGVETANAAIDALPGAAAVFLNSRALGDGLADVVAAARRSGVTKLVALSAINADDDFSRQPSRFRGDRNKEVEQLAIDSGLDWVSLRPAVFASNFAGMWSAQVRAGDVVGGPYAAASSAPIVDADIAAVAAQALLTDELVGQQIPLTGPHAFTNTELVEVIGTVLDRPLRYVEAPPEVVRQRFIGLGLGAEFADAYTAMLAETVDSPALVTREVEKITGRPATTFAQWVSDTPSAVHEITKGDRHVRSTSTALPQADEQGDDGRPEARHPHRPRDGVDGAGPQVRQAAQYPDDAVRIPRRPVRSGRLSGCGLGRQRQGRRQRHAEQRPAFPAGQDRRTDRRAGTSGAAGISGRSAGRRGLRRNAPERSSEGTPDEFEALAGRIAVFRFDPVTPV